jgi:hypothetical protein
MFVLLVIEDDDDGHLREIVGPFATRAAAAAYRQHVNVERTEVVELKSPPVETL